MRRILAILLLALPLGACSISAGGTDLPEQVLPPIY